MVYKEGFIACCKVDGKILREDAGVVTLPFGCEYSILLKNLNSVRAQVKVSVDGTDATEGTWLIVPANGEIELERYIRNGNFERGNKFKFIERTGQIEANKGIGAADGLIRVEYKSEVVDIVRKTVVDHVEHVYHHRPYWYPYYYWLYDPFYRGPWLGEITCNSLTSQNIGTTTTSNLGDAQSANIGSATGQSINTANMGSVMGSAQGSATPPGSSPLRSYSASLGGSHGSLHRMKSSIPMRKLSTAAAAGPRGKAGAQRKMMSFVETEVERGALNDVGITVPGSESNQRFTAGPWFKTETTSHVIVLQLRGMIAGKAVKTAVTVKSKAKCATCGTVNKSSIKFCGNCGTSLALI